MDLSSKLQSIRVSKNQGKPTAQDLAGLAALCNWVYPANQKSALFYYFYYRGGIRV